MSIERIEQCILGLKRYGLLQGRVKTINIQFAEYVKEIQVTSGTATSSEWLAWVFRWPKDPMSHSLDD